MMNSIAYNITSTQNITISAYNKRDILHFRSGMSNQPAALQRFYILTFKNSTYIFRRFLNSISINECFISLIFYTRFILLIKR